MNRLLIGSLFEVNVNIECRNVINKESTKGNQTQIQPQRDSIQTSLAVTQNSDRGHCFESL